VSLFEWKPGFSVGITTVDSQHQKLVGYMNQFHIHSTLSKTKEAKESLVALLRYTKIHFHDEEQLMERHHYTDLVAHQATHKELLVILGKLAKAYQDEPTLKNAENMSNYMKAWLANHILGTDKRYGPFLLDHGAK
jgi:hemerythrin